MSWWSGREHDRLAVWHLIRVQDDHLADLMDTEQIWTAQDWVGRAAGLAEADLDRIVDEAWDPPVTLGVRLVSVLSDDLQHAGQAAYVRGLVLRDT